METLEHRLQPLFDSLDPGDARRLYEGLILVKGIRTVQELENAYISWKISAEDAGLRDTRLERYLTDKIFSVGPVTARRFANYLHGQDFAKQYAL